MKRSPMPKRAAGLRHRSRKTAKLYIARRLFVAETLEARPKCEAHWDAKCQIRSVDVHEILPRSQGGLIVGDEPENYLAVCRWCHEMIETHPLAAHARGYRKWSWEAK